MQDLADLEPEEQQKRIKPAPEPFSAMVYGLLQRSVQLVAVLRCLKGSALLTRWRWGRFLQGTKDAPVSWRCFVSGFSKVLVFSDPMVDLLAELGLGIRSRLTLKTSHW